MSENQCQFSKKLNNLLGYTIENNQLNPDHERFKFLIPSGIAIAKQYSINTTSTRHIGFNSKVLRENSKFSQLKIFSLASQCNRWFQNLKLDISNPLLYTITDNKPFVAETDASAITATLSSRCNRYVAFNSKTLSDLEIERRWSTQIRQTSQHFNSYWPLNLCSICKYVEICL